MAHSTSISRDARRRRLCAVGNSFVAAIALLPIAGPVRAHHSGAMYHPKQTITLLGSVRVFQWTNPHCWIQLLVPGKGLPVEWSVEMGSPGELFRLGWRPGSLKPGETLRVVVRPARDGTSAGKYVSAIREDGSPVVAPHVVVTAGAPP